MSDELACYELELNSTTALHDPEDPEQFLTEYRGCVTRTDLEAGSSVRAGWVQAVRVNVDSAAEAGVPLAHVCDARSNELLDAYDRLYQPGEWELRAEVSEAFDALRRDVLVLEFVVLAPAWRGRGLGRAVVQRLIDVTAGGCDLAVACVLPLNRAAHRELRVPARWIPRPTGWDGLVRYFESMGFRRLGDGPYFARSLTQTQPGAN